MLSVKVLLEGHGWQTGRVLSADAVEIDGTGVVPVSKVRAIVHHPREEQPPHEAPGPLELGYVVLLGAVFFPEKRFELEMAAGWRDAKGWMVRPETGSTSSAALTVTSTNGALALAP